MVIYLFIFLYFILFCYFEGLMIIKAEYGIVNRREELMSEYIYQNDDNNESIVPSIDVTIPLQFFVKDSCLEIIAGSKSKILGFYNPLELMNGGKSKQKLDPELYVFFALIYFDTTDKIYLLGS